EAILAAINAGLIHFGENRVEESLIKVPFVDQETNNQAIWHFIGHIQSRKTKDIVPLFDVIHSVDRMKIAQKLSELAQAENRQLAILAEINISGEHAKDGFEASKWKTDEKIKEQLW